MTGKNSGHFLLKTNHKPGSVIAKGEFLSFIYATYPPASGGQPLKRRFTWSYNLRGRRPGMSPCLPVSSYLTFSPFPWHEPGWLFSFLLLCPREHLFFKSGVPCVARTFLITLKRTRQAGSSFCKISKFKVFPQLPEVCRKYNNHITHPDKTLSRNHNHSSTIAIFLKRGVLIFKIRIFSIKCFS